MHQLETERLLLRDWTDEDVEEWVALGADPHVMAFFESISTRERSLSTAARLRELLTQRGWGWWVCEVKGGPRFAGVLPIQPIPHGPHRGLIEIGWRLRSELWGRGYATEGGRALIDFGLRVLKAEQIVAMTAEVNLPSRRVMERLGMTHDPADDFDHPSVSDGHRLKRHVLYRTP